MHVSVYNMVSYPAQVVIKICIPSTEVSSQQGRMCCEHSCHWNLAGARENKPRSRLPLVEMTNDIWLVSEVVRQLERCWKQQWLLFINSLVANKPIAEQRAEHPTDTPADLFEEPGDQGAQDKRVIGLSVVVGQANVAGLPEVPLPPLQVPGSRGDVEQDHIGAALD